MKNFRKVLALVLVVATLFSFTAMTSAAYEDADKISYEEAVDVLSAVGILNGYEIAEDEYEFKPTQTISREEMAKMIAVLANAGDDVSTLYASACTFADVPSSKWSASYVAYCAKTGIVAGRSATTFDPAGKVTGLETAKMLLVVLGFNAEKQGYVGSDWKINVLRDAKVMGLLEGFAADYDVDANITREEAANMMLNALKAPCVVGILSNGLVNVTNALVVNWSGLGNGNMSSMITNLLKVTAYAQLKDAFQAGKWALYGNVIISNDLLATRLYDLDETTGRDCYGRPTTVWTKNGKEVVEVKTEPVWSSYKTDLDAAAAALKKATGKTEYDLYKNGVKGDWAEGKGVLVEVFADGTISSITTEIGILEQINTAKGLIKIGGVWYDNDYGFKSADEGKVVLYWPCNEVKWDDKDGDNMHAVELAVAETVTVHGTNIGAIDYFCATNGEKYEYVAGFAIEDRLGKEALGETILVYTDKYGYVMLIDTEAEETFVTVLVPKSANRVLVSENNYNNGKYEYTAKFVEFEDGAAEAVADTDVTIYDHDVPVNTVGGAFGLLITYKLNDDGERELVSYADGFGMDGSELSKSSYKITVNDGNYNGTIVGTNNTQYLLRVYDFSKGAYVYKYFDGKDEIDDTYKLSNIQFYEAEREGYASYVFAEATYSATVHKAFVVKYDAKQSYVNEAGVKQEYFLYDAYIGTEEVVVAYESPLTLGNDGEYGFVTAKYIKMTAETHDGKPVYRVEGTDYLQEGGYNFYIDAGTLQYTDKNGVHYADIAEDAVYYVITKTKDANGKYVVTSKTVDADEMNDFCETYGWNNVRASIHVDTNNDVSALYVYSVID